MSKLQLLPGAERRLRAGHHWIYSNEIDSEYRPLSACSSGEVLDVQDHRGRALGSFAMNPATLICGRLVSRQSGRQLTSSLIKNRLKQALELRDMLFAEPCYRWVYGDSDGLSGLVVDRFYDVLCVQVSSLVMESQLPLIVELLERLVQPEGILLKNDGKMRSVEGLPSYVNVASGDIPEWVPLVENGVKFHAPLLTGQKTGWFYDHRPNRLVAAELSVGKQVLDVFSYLGGWGVTAAAKGAESVTAVDVSELALQGCRDNARLNGVERRVTTRQGDAFEVLQQLHQEKQRFDVVIVDPPAFIARRKDISVGERAYLKLNEAAMKLVRHGGVLVSASCSMHLEQDRLRDIVRQCSRKLDRHLRILAEGSQGADHPVLPAVKETRYIKAIFAQVSKSF